MENERICHRENSSRKNKVGRIIFPNFKAYKPVVIKTMRYWQKILLLFSGTEWRDQIDPRKSNQMNYDKRAKDKGNSMEKG